MERVNMAFVPQLVLNRKVKENKIDIDNEITTLFLSLDRQPVSNIEDDKDFFGENGVVVFYDEIPLILEHPK